MRYLFLAVFLLAAAAQAQPLKTLLITGENNHNWRFTSRVHEETLETTGRFDVTITEKPGADLANPETLAGVRVIVVDYNADPRWPAAAEKALADAVRGGVGLVLIHSANNAFRGTDWAEYEQMAGLMWRDGAGHGKFHAFDVEFTDREHPITKGLPDFKAHPDELYHSLANPRGAEFHLLARAMSSKESGGTGKHEPMAFTLAFGKGRVFSTPLGHVWPGAHDQKVSVLDPQFRALLTRGTEWAATGAVTLPAAWKDVRPLNEVPPMRHNRWRALLSDDKAEFRGYRSKEKALPAGWEVKGGVLHRLPNAAAGDVVTLEEFDDFTLELEYKLAPGGNSGVIYRCGEETPASYETGPEFQVLDDSGHPQADGKHKAGALYDVYANPHDLSRPAGQWNTVRIWCKGWRIQHWLNGILVVDADLASEDARKLIAASKWKDHPGFATLAKGRIALQDHGDEVWYRNIKIRDGKW